MIISIINSSSSSSSIVAVVIRCYSLFNHYYSDLRCRVTILSFSCLAKHQRYVFGVVE